KRPPRRIKSRQPLRPDRNIRRCGGAAVPERGQEPRLCPGRPSTGQVDRGVGGLIVPPRRRLPQAFARRVKSVRRRSGFARAALLASPLIVLARTGLIGPSLAQ